MEHVLQCHRLSSLIDRAVSKESSKIKKGNEVTANCGADDVLEYIFLRQTEVRALQNRLSNFN